jgi:hypothetical protein
VKLLFLKNVLAMKRGLSRIIWIAAILCALALFCYLRSDSRKLALTDKIYAELKHPEWSTRLIKAKYIYPNEGSGNYNMLYLVDVRQVSIPLSNAISYYESEGDRLGLKEFHVEGYGAAREEFQQRWDDLNLQIAQGSNILVLSQLFSLDSNNIRRHEPYENP